ncbi:MULTISPECIES: ATP-binding protein [Micromonospora]|uniref:ATP-binding protein n=2 Tax=Micromonospora chalcea TaxID=1874 RepID=A0ABX9Y2M4_MICCH|nr:MULTISPECIES: ATP-binding protein [Micromonospora]MBC8992000.1 ATP-binding protein [Micromonospora chalcea]MBQ1062223.1 ATP-binding protein [Micromonospora sp. C41]MBQ1067774.1 ATP-binding protein [Micromonospora sp. D75]MCK1806626.1 ATP-binding protein [Micromonospora sp. R42106]MCK1834784.1 ATP-binding protein [Micromonospora sp. R42003]
MVTRIRCEVRDESPVTVVRLAGALDLGTMRAVHEVLDRCLAAQPDALVVDLEEIEVGEPLALSVFAAAARRAADWPAVPMVLAAPCAETAAWLNETTACRVVPVRRDCAEAAALAGADSAPRLRARLEPVAGACRRARELVTEACGRWNVPELAGPASLVLSELVGNVVRHAGTPMQVTLTLRRPYLRVAVMDGSPADARAATSRDPRAEGGRGLMLVRELTQRWGSTPVGAGKVVWAMLPAN